MESEHRSRKGSLRREDHQRAPYCRRLCTGNTRLYLFVYVCLECGPVHSLGLWDSQVWMGLISHTSPLLSAAHSKSPSELHCEASWGGDKHKFTGHRPCNHAHSWLCLQLAHLSCWPSPNKVLCLSLEATMPASLFWLPDSWPTWWTALTSCLRCILPVWETDQYLFSSSNTP